MANKDVSDEEIVEEIRRVTDENGELTLDETMSIVAKYRKVTPELRQAFEEIWEAHNNRLLNTLRGN